MTGRSGPGAGVARAIDGLCNAGLVAMTGLILLIGTLVLADVVSRWIGISLLFISNVVLLAAIWLAYAGIAQTHRVDGHVGVDTVVQMLPARVRARLAVFNELVCIAVAAVVLWSACQQMILSYTYHVVMLGSFRMPVWIAQAAIPVGMAMLLLQCVRKLVRHARREAAPAAER